MVSLFGCILGFLALLLAGPVLWIAFFLAACIDFLSGGGAAATTTDSNPPDQTASHIRALTSPAPRS